MQINGILLERDEQKNFHLHCTPIAMDKVLEQEGDTLVKVDYSTLNYKDALALTNSSPVVRMWPMVPGIDGVGTVVECKTGKLKAGDKVILNGWGCGETHWGCLAQMACLESKWLIPLPSNITPWQSMAIGTAGYTAALCVQAILKHGVKPEDGKILVSGATGGVGSIAVILLAKLGYEVTAITGKMQDAAYLQKLGAKEVLDRSAFKDAGKPLQKEVWAAAVDALGSHTLANICAQTQYGGIVAACGLAQGFDLPTTVMPFILRGLTLAGIDSVMAPYQKRVDAWSLLSQHLDLTLLEDVAHTIKLSECADVAQKIMGGQLTGRCVVDVNS
ncbi:MAG: MDR family oxidoreductase [Saezia sp.]